MLAEFNALRSEIVGRLSSQAALVGIGLTALGVVVGLAVKEDGDQRLLLALPPLAALVNLLWSIENRRVTLAGSYIRKKLWPELQRLSGVPYSWEKDVQARRSGHGVLFSLLAEGMLVVVFAGTALIGLVVADDTVSGKLDAAEWVLVVVAFVVPARDSEPKNLTLRRGTHSARKPRNHRVHRSSSSNAGAPRCAGHAGQVGLVKR